MARKRGSESSGQSSPYGSKHPLLVYRLVARRYRPMGVLLFALGLLAQLPWFVPELRLRGTILTYEQLAYFGLGLLTVGALIWIISIFRARRAYIQCLPQYLVIRTPSSLVAVAYQRFNEIKTVKVGDMFAKRDLKSAEWTFIKPLRPSLALEAVVADYPLAEKTVRRRLSKFLFSPREQGFLFIVPIPSKLALEIDSFASRARESRTDAQRQYLDPIQRAQYQATGQTR